MSRRISLIVLAAIMPALVLCSFNALFPLESSGRGQ